MTGARKGGSQGGVTGQEEDGSAQSIGTIPVFAWGVCGLKIILIQPQTGLRLQGFKPRPHEWQLHELHARPTALVSPYCS